MGNIAIMYLTGPIVAYRPFLLSKPSAPTYARETVSREAVSQEDARQPARLLENRAETFIMPRFHVPATIFTRDYGRSWPLERAARL